MKGTMVIVKRVRGIKTRNLSHCKVLKYARENELDWDQNDLGKAQAEERTKVDVCPDSPSKDPPSSLPEIEVGGDPQQTDDHARQGLRRSARVRTSTWNTLYKDFVLCRTR